MKFWRWLLDRIAAAIPILVLSTSVSAQDHTATVREVIDRLKAQGVDLSGACGALRITNAVALELPGFKLLRKQGGWRAIPQPNGGCLDGDHASGPGYATDYLIAVNEGFVGYDLLGDGGGANTPQWSGPENGADVIVRNAQNAADPFGMAPPPPPPPPPPPSPGADYTTLLQRILDSQDRLLEAQQDLLVITKDTNAHVVAMDRTLTQTLGSVSKFLAKYVAPAIGGYVMAKQMTKPDPATAKPQ